MAFTINLAVPEGSYSRAVPISTYHISSKLVEILDFLLEGHGIVNSTEADVIGTHKMERNLQANVAYFRYGWQTRWENFPQFFISVKNAFNLRNWLLYHVSYISFCFFTATQKRTSFCDVWKFDCFLKFFNQPNSGGVLGSITYSSVPNKRPVFLLGTFVGMKYRSLPQP